MINSPIGGAGCLSWHPTQPRSPLRSFRPVSVVVSHSSDFVRQLHRLTFPFPLPVRRVSFRVVAVHAKPHSLLPRIVPKTVTSCPFFACRLPQLPQYGLLTIKDLPVRFT